MVENKKSDTIEIPIGKYVSAVKRNPWIVVSVVLAVVIVLLLIFGNGSGKGVTSLSADEVGQKILDLAKSQVGDASLTSVNKVGDHYEIKLDIGGSPTTVLVSLDGNYLLQQISGDNTQQPTNTATLKISDLDLSKYLSLGNVSAPVTVVEFSDFSCPFCAAASGDNAELVAYMKQRDSTWEPIVTNLMKDYVNTGKVRFVYIYAMGHSGGKPASQVAWCVYDQSSALFSKFYAAAFANQSDVEDLNKMKALAKSIGADSNKLQACLDSDKYSSRFTEEQSIADQVGVQGTPAFFVNDEYVARGAMSYTQFKAAVESALGN